MAGAPVGNAYRNSEGLNTLNAKISSPKMLKQTELSKSTLKFYWNKDSLDYKVMDLLKRAAKLERLPMFNWYNMY